MSEDKVKHEVKYGEYGLGSYIYRWVLGAMVIGVVEAIFCIWTFDILPFSLAASGLAAYVIFAVLAGTFTFLFLYPSRASTAGKEAFSHSLFLAFLVFFSTAVMIRRTPYLLDRFGQSQWLFAAAAVTALVCFFILRWAGRRIEKPVPFYLASVVLMLLAFLLVRQFNHYSYDDTIFFKPPALYMNTALVVLFFPAYYIVYKLFGLGAVEKVFDTLERRGGLILLLALTVIMYVGVESYAPGQGTPGSRPNIILLVMDTTRKDFLSCYGHQPETSPNIDALAAEGVVFENNVATAPWTIPTHSSMFSGLYTSSHGAHWEHLYLDDTIETVGEILADRGYRTVGFSNNPVVSRSTNLDQGYSDFYEMWKNASRFPTLYSQIKDFVIYKMGRADAGAERTNEMIEGWLERRYDREQPFFMFINFMEPHLVYNPPVQYRRQFAKDDEVTARMSRITIHTVYEMLADESSRGLALAPEEVKALRSLYEGEIAYLDSRIGELVEYLRSRDYLDNTLLIITADHGENIGEHDLIDHQLSLYDTTLLIPLIIRYPSRIPGGTRIDDLVQSVDIFPTMLDVAGVEEEDLDDSVLGRSLFFNIRGEPGRTVAFSEYMSPKNQFQRVQRWAEARGKVAVISRFDRRLKSMRSVERKYIWSSDDLDEMYMISRDPGEVDNLKETGADEFTGMEEELERWATSLPRMTKENSEIPEMDSETRDLLKALGYVD